MPICVLRNLTYCLAGAKRLCCTTVQHCSAVVLLYLGYCCTAFSTAVPGTPVQHSALSNSVLIVCLVLSSLSQVDYTQLCGLRCCDSPNILSSIKPNPTSFRILGHLRVFAPSSKVLQQAHRRSSQKRHLDCSLREKDQKGYTSD